MQQLFQNYPKIPILTSREKREVFLYFSDFHSNGKRAYYPIVGRGNCFRQARSCRRALLLATLPAFLLLPTAPIAQAADRWIDGDAPFGICHPSLSRHFWRGAPCNRKQKNKFWHRPAWILRSPIPDNPDDAAPSQPRRRRTHLLFLTGIAQTV